MRYTNYLIAGFTGPAFPYTVAALETAFGSWIESTSIAVAAGCGISLAVATGPV